MDLGKELPTLETPAGSPFSQFKSLCSLTDYFNLPENRDLDYLLSVEGEFSKFDFKSSLNLINRLRIINIIRSIDPDNNLWHEKSAEITAALKAANYWVERVHDQTLTSREITIFAPLPFHMSSVEDSERLAHSYDHRTRKSSERAISNIIDRAHEVLESYGRSEFSDLIKDRDGLISEYFPSIVDIHHEVTDNAYRHALRSPLTNIWMDDEKNNNGFFGDTLYLQINRLTISSSGRVVLEKSSSNQDYPESLRAYVDSRAANSRLRSFRGRGRILSFAYGDNGPGPLRHIKKYAPEHVRNEINTLSDVFRNGFSSRPDIKGSGSGFNNMVSAARIIKGYVCVRSGKTTVYYDGLQDKFGEEIDPSINTERGTMVFLMFGL